VTSFRLRFFDRGVAVIGAMTAVVVVLESPAAHAGCTRDSDCKGARICEKGRCVNPPADNQAQGSGAVRPTPPAPPAPATWQAAPPPALAPMPLPPQNAQMSAPGSPAPPAQMAPAPAGTVGTAAPSWPQQAAAPVPMATGLTEANLSDLKNAGASLDAKDMEIADRLLRRGFSGDEIAAAYREHNVLKLTYPELGRFGRDMVETVAVARKLSLGENDKYWLVWYRHDENLSLTDAYNRKVVGGPRLKTLGWILAPAGLVLVIVGVPMWRWALTEETDRRGLTDQPNGDWALPGLVMTIAGSVFAAVGIPALIVGYLRTSHWLPPGSLDSAPADSIPSLRASAREPAVRWAVTPLVGPNQASLGLRGSF
jgi:hypothetical protein